MRHFYLLMCCLAVCTVNAQHVSLNSINVQYDQLFDSLANSGSSSVMPKGWFISESGTSSANNGLYATGTGSSNAGDTYSFGTSGSSDRALGGLRSGTLVPIIGGGFMNHTGTTIRSLQVQYRGEQWRLGTANRGSDRLDFQISFDATSLTTGTWSNVDELDFIGPVNAGTVGALVGNNNGVSIAFEIFALNIANGQTFFLRWLDVDVSGADDGLSIDNFSLTPVGTASEPSIAFSPAIVNFGEINAGASATSSYEIILANLTDEIDISVSDSAYSLSVDNVSFASELSLPSTGGIVYVKFSPQVNGPANTTIGHTSGSYSKSLSVTGSGFVQAENIIPISVARAKSVGTKVTVAGRITVAYEHANPAYIQDATGGIPVFDFPLASSVAIGDSVIVTGPIGLFNDQKQISGSGIFFTKIETAPRIPAPKIISLGEMASNEGFLVTIPNIEMVNKSFVFYPQSTEQITDGTIVADLRIDGDTDIPGLAKPQGHFDITGVVGRFKTNAQLLPRFEADVPGAVEPSTPADSISKDLTFDIANWNLEFFGARREDYPEEYGPADEVLQAENVKRVLDSLNADIVAIEEVSDEVLFAQTVSQIPNYDFICSPRFSHDFDSDGTFPPQKVCFIFDTTTVQVKSVRPMFVQLYDSARLFDASLLPGYPGGDPSSFWSSGRLPFLLEAKATVQGVTESISLIVIHAKSGSTVSDLNRRTYDAQVLKDSLDMYFSNKQVVVLGDLNDDLDQSIVTGHASSYANFVGDASYHPITKALSDANARSTVSFNDVIDHQIITTELDEEYLAGSATIIAPFRMIKNYAATTSDHLPVMSRYRFVAPVLSLDSAMVSIIEGDSSAFTVTAILSKPAASSLDITISVAGDAEISDYTTSPATIGNQITVHFNEADSTAQFILHITDDTLDEFDESLTFTLQPAQGVTLGNTSSYFVIVDNDIPSISFAEASSEVTEGQSRSIQLNLSTPPVEDQMVTLRLSESRKADYGIDYTTDPASSNGLLQLSIPAGTSSAYFEFNAISDRRTEKPEIVSFALRSTSGGLQQGDENVTDLTIINHKRELHFAVFPNPTRDVIRISCDDVDADEELQIDIRDGNGHTVLSAAGTIDALNQKIARTMAHEKRGLYTLQVIAEEEVIVIRVLKI